MEATAQRTVDPTQTIPESAPLARIPEVMNGPTFLERQAPENIAAAALRTEAQTFTCSPEIDQLAAGLAAAQFAFTAIEKNLTADVQSRREGAKSYQYDYAPLSEVLQAVRPALNANGIAILQPPGTGQKSIVITTLLLHASGQWFRSDLRFPFSMEHVDPQAFGTVVSYIRRYCVMSILGVAPEEAEDDDAAKVTAQMRQQPRSNGNGHSKPATVPMPERASVQQPPAPTAFPLTRCDKKTPEGRDPYWAATWRGKDVVAFGEIGAALDKAFRANRLIKDLVTHEKPAAVGNKVFTHVDEIVFGGAA